MSRNTLNILALAPACDDTDVGEAWAGHQWVSGLSQRHNVTLLTMRKHGRASSVDQLPGIEVVEWDDIPLAHRFERINSMLKPGYVSYYVKARRWIRQNIDAGRHFDIAHQFTPIALRYPSPAAGLGIPLIMGPLAGSLETPAGFQQECSKAPWFTKLRGIDRLRLRHDGLLRKTYSDAHVVLGVAPYVESLLSEIPLKRFAMISELGLHELPEKIPSKAEPGKLRIAHVGRAIRTKGLRDVVRAMSLLKHRLDIVMESAGDGEDLENCRREAEALGVSDRITFHGKIPRQQVEDIYRRSDVFVFPSFREPSGSVIFESMRHGLPVVTTDLGGPAHVIDDSCGIKVSASTPEVLADQLANALSRLASDPDLVRKLGAGARHKAESVGLWPKKIDWLCKLYNETLLTK